MTPAMGGHRYRCQDCDNEFWICHGCRNRSCPKCHGRQMQEWLACREAELLPCGYYHLVATVPEQLRHAFLADQKFMYSLLMKTVAGAVIDLVRNEKRIGATPGMLMILHTWTRQMTYHPHVHLLVTAGGVSDDGRHWLAGPDKFLLPVRRCRRSSGQDFATPWSRRSRKSSAPCRERRGNGRGVATASPTATANRPCCDTWPVTPSASRSPTPGSSPWMQPM